MASSATKPRSRLTNTAATLLLAAAVGAAVAGLVESEIGFEAVALFVALIIIFFFFI